VSLSVALSRSSGATRDQPGDGLGGTNPTQRTMPTAYASWVAGLPISWTSTTSLRCGLRRTMTQQYAPERPQVQRLPRREEAPDGAHLVLPVQLRQREADPRALWIAFPMHFRGDDARDLADGPDVESPGHKTSWIR
jgi:hypothetical protein